MNLHQIQLFVSVAETGSFSRAAEKFTLNQSTISQHIAALEDEIGSPLLDRTPKGALPTASGKVFLRHARRILAECDALRQAMNSFSGLQNVELRIGASNIPANYLVPPLVPVLSKNYPGIALNMKSGDSLEIIEALVAAEIELAIVGSRPEQKGVHFEPVADDHLVLVVGPQHRLHGRQSVPLAELLAEPLIVREDGSGSGKALETELKKAGIDPGQLNVRARLGSNEAVLQSVAAHCGCAFVSAMSIPNLERTGQLHRVGVENFSVERKIWAARMRDRSLSPAAEVFLGLLLERGNH